MATITTPFEDAIEKVVPKTGSGSVKTGNPNHMVSGLPERTGGMLPEVTYDTHIPDVKANREPGESMFMIKK